MEGLQKIAMSVSNKSLEVALNHIALKSGQFANTLYKKKTSNLNELRHKVDKFMSFEKLNDFLDQV